MINCHYEEDYARFITTVCHGFSSEGYGIDFLAQSPEGEWLLLQICADLSNAATREREVRALVAASTEYAYATPILITLDAVPPQPGLPEPLQWQSAAAWLLDYPLDEG